MSGPKILLLDIETAPGKAYIWSLFDDAVPLERLIEPGRIICWAAKWYKGGWGSADERGGRRDMLQPLHEMLNAADAVVTYNGDKFDLPRINGEFLANGMAPVAPVPSIDLWRTAKSLGFQSTKLAFVSPHLGIGQKVETGGFKLWRDVMNGDGRAWARMLRYNKQDVALLERLYNKLRPYIKSHPALHRGNVCGSCGSARLQRRGHRHTRAFAIERLSCNGCGTWQDGKRSKV